VRRGAYDAANGRDGTPGNQEPPSPEDVSETAADGDDDGSDEVPSTGAPETGLAMLHVGNTKQRIKQT
jgi:hypothetical protein